MVDARGEDADKRLVAWLVVRDMDVENAALEDSASNGQPMRDDLRAHLRALLPEWMVPSVFVFVETLPLTPSGKIDRKALPNPDTGQFGTGAKYVAPQTESEIKMAELWAEVLGVEKVGLQDNFFDLGGHSLLAVRLLSQVSEHFSIDAPLRVLFQAPTVSEFLKAIGGPWVEAGGEKIELDAEARLEDSIRPQGKRAITTSRVEDPKNVFVTGATGFLGVYLVGELLRGCLKPGSVN